MKKASQDGGGGGARRRRATSLTIRTTEQFYSVADTDIHDTKETLVLLLELPLVENLDRQYTVLVHTATK